MAWWQFSLDCRASELEQVEDLMQALGASSISLGDAADEPIYEPLPGTTPVWEKSVLTATFDAECDPEMLYRRIVAALPDRIAASVRRHRLEDEDWEQAYKTHFKPIQCAPGLWIVPSWSEPPDPDATIINLDPGLAFGTGSHPTTALCLAWLGTHDVSGLRVIDYGCGSGVLAIAACKLGAQEVIAVDIDAQALRACEANIDANGIETSQVRVCLPEALEQRPADLLVANILAGPLIELAPRLAGLVAPGGRILLSGILKSQLEDIQLSYQPYFDLDPARSLEDWACISGKRFRQA